MENREDSNENKWEMIVTLLIMFSSVRDLVWVEWQAKKDLALFPLISSHEFISLYHFATNTD